MGTQGLQFGAVIDDTGHVLFTPAVAQLIAQAGAAWVRINFRLNGFQNWTETTTYGYSALSLYDQIIANARNAGLQVLGLLSNEAWNGGQPAWQANNTEVSGGSGDNAYIQAFSQNAAVVLAQHFASQITWWEVWNEPNIGATFIYPSNFAWLLGRVYTEVRALVPSARFVSGGLASQDANGNITNGSTGADYLSSTYTRGKATANWNGIKTSTGSYPLDAIGQHIYIDGFKKTTGPRIKTTLDLVHTAYVQGEGGSTTKKTHVTEVGWATNNVSERNQSSNLQTTYTQFKATSYGQTAYWFFLRDEPAAPLYFGLLRPDATQKPAWTAYKTYAT